MLEVLLFSFSISIDAFGYSMGFGTRNIKIKRLEFLVLNLINSLILSILLISFSNVSYVLNNIIIKSVSPLLLMLFGFYYIIQSFVDLFKNKEIGDNQKQKIFINKKEGIFKLWDLMLLLLVFLFENAFSTFIFYTSMTKDIFFFVASNFIFHYLFFLIGFDLGGKIIKKFGFNSSFLSGFIFIFLGIFNLFY